MTNRLFLLNSEPPLRVRTFSLGFAAHPRAHVGDSARIRWVSMDMLHCYTKRVRENFPNAEVVFDRYHPMVMAGEAVDLVRRQLQHRGADLKGSL